MGNVFNVRIRGISSEQNSVTVDGNKMASSGGMARNFRLGAISGALFDEVEVTKASTPEMDADSLGGGVNFKTRSALASRDRRRGTYRVGVRWLPPFTDQTVYRQDHRTAPLFNLSYTQIFDVGGGERNLGVTLTANGSQNNRGAKVTQQERLDTTSGPSYVRTFVANDVYNAGRQESYGVRFDYKISDRSSVYFTTKISDASQRTLAELKTTASVNTPRVLAVDAGGQPTGPGQIYPDFTDTVTRVRAQPTNFFEINTFTRHGKFRNHRQEKSCPHYAPLRFPYRYSRQTPPSTRSRPTRCKCWSEKPCLKVIGSSSPGSCMVVVIIGSPRVVNSARAIG